MHQAVASLFKSCPFLVSHCDDQDFDLPTIVFGDVAQILMAHKLSNAEENAVFEYFNALAENGSKDDLTILGAGAIELFNDSAETQRLARKKFKGEALAILEGFRKFWGQPNYNEAHS